MKQINSHSQFIRRWHKVDTRVDTVKVCEPKLFPLVCAGMLDFNPAGECPGSSVRSVYCKT